MDDDRTFEIVERTIDRGDGQRDTIPRKDKNFSRQDVVNAFQRTFEMIGGVTRMALWADANPDKFYPLYTKLLPSTAIAIGTNQARRVEHAIPPTALDMHPDENGVYVAPEVVPLP